MSFYDILMKCMLFHFDLSISPKLRYRFVDGNPNFFGGDMAKLQLAAMQSEEAFGEAQRSSMGTLEYEINVPCLLSRHEIDARTKYKLTCLYNLVQI